MDTTLEHRGSSGKPKVGQCSTIKGVQELFGSIPLFDIKAILFIFCAVYKGPRGKMGQPEIKSWILHELHKTLLKTIHTLKANGQDFESFPNLGGVYTKSL